MSPSFLLALRYRFRFWKRRFYRWFGFCGDCGSKLNWTFSDRWICPECGR